MFKWSDFDFRYISEARYSSPPLKTKFGQRGSLADVNLELDCPPTPLPFIKTRRSSRIDNVELDILGTGRRTSRDLETGIWNIRQTIGDGSKSDSSNVISFPKRPLTENNQKYTTNKTLKTEKQRSNQNSDTVNYNEGKRPSLADLITVYETSREDVE